MTERNSHTENAQNAEFNSGYVDLFTILVIIWRRKFIILATLILGVVAAFLLISSVQPRYTAEGGILIKLDANSLSPDQLLKQAKASIFDVGPILTEIELIKSRKMAAEVVDKLNLTQDPNFKPRENQNQILVQRAPDNLFRSLAVEEKDLQTLPPEAIDPQVSAAVTHLVDSLRVFSVPGSLAVNIVYTSPNPEKSARIVNTYIDEYINLKQSEKRKSQDRITLWLDNRLITLRKNLLDIETEIEKFKIKNKLNPDKQEAVTIRQIVSLNDQYTQAKEKYNELQAQMDQLSKPGNESLLSAINSQEINTSLLRQLQSQKIELETRRNDLSNRYGPKHPAMIKVQTELNEVSAAIEAEYQKIKNVVRNELNIAKKRVQNIEKSIDGEIIEENQDGEALAQLNDLEREAEASRLVLKTFMEAYKRSLDRSELLESNVDVISYAAIPLDPSYPNKILLLSLSIFVSLLLGVFLAFITERVSLMRYS